MEEWAPAGWAYPWDKAGLAIGEPGARVTGALVCLTVTREVYAAARAAKANLVVSHHPLIWEPLKSLRLDDPLTRLCLDFARARIACYSAHTNLDVAPGGVNHVLAQKLGLKDVGPLLRVSHGIQVKLVTFVPESHLAQVRDAVAEAGAGVIGDYTHCSFSAPGTGTFKPSARSHPFSGSIGKVNEEPEQRFEVLVNKARLGPVLEALFRAHPYEEVAYDVFPVDNLDPRLSLGLQGALPRPVSAKTFAAHVRRALQLSHVRMTGPAGKMVRRVAVLGGSGGGEAGGLPPGIDAYVTGDVRYHDAIDAGGRNLVVIDAGHAGTERLIVPVIADYLRTRFPDLNVAEFQEPECFRVL